MKTLHFISGVVKKKSSQAEVDFIINVHTQIIPIEVKAGITGRLKSLNMFMGEKQVSRGVRVSQQPFNLTKNILSLPIYMIGELSRLILE